jgi:hypothetical protein
MFAFVPGPFMSHAKAASLSKLLTSLGMFTRVPGPSMSLAVAPLYGVLRTTLGMFALAPISDPSMSLAVAPLYGQCRAVIMTAILREGGSSMFEAKVIFMGLQLTKWLLASWEQRAL